MLRRTFQHLPGLGEVSERRLWDAGVRHWDDSHLAAGVEGVRGLGSLEEGLALSRERLAAGDARHFASALRRGEKWRLWRDFRASMACVDIETTGLGAPDDHPTTVAVWDGEETRTFVYGRDLDDVPDALEGYSLLVTYNGEGFDLPFLRRWFGHPFDQAHLDLCPALRRVGLKGGLKGVERRLGLERPGMAGLDGFAAVLLWRRWERHHDEDALETLLAYNVADTTVLETLAVVAHNLHVAATPFVDLEEELPPMPANPHRADPGTVASVTPLARSWR